MSFTHPRTSNSPRFHDIETAPSAGLMVMMPVPDLRRYVSFISHTHAAQ